jgi:hypothetical protein
MNIERCKSLREIDFKWCKRFLNSESRTDWSSARLSNRKQGEDPCFQLQL